MEFLRMLFDLSEYLLLKIWSNYSDLTRPYPKWWFSKGNPLISGKTRLVKYYNLARKMGDVDFPSSHVSELGVSTS